MTGKNFLSLHNRLHLLPNVLSVKQKEVKKSPDYEK